MRLRLHIITHLLRVSEDLLQALLEAVNVVIDQMLPVDLVLVDQADQGQTLVNFSQVQNDVLLVVCVSQSNDRGGLLVKLRSILLVIAIDTGDVNENIDQLRADLVVLHVYRC